MKLNKRRKTILEASVKHFIKIGEPITSERLYYNFDFGIKPAMIRWELNALGDAEYFYQEHPSGGRYPTNKAYRFLVDELLEDEEEKNSSFSKSFDLLFDEFVQGNKKVFIRDFAQYLKVLGIGYDYKLDYLYESGLDELLSKLETETKNDLLQVVEDFENLSERLEDKIDWWQKEKNWPQVFIGESPITKSEHLSIIVGKLDQGREKLLLIAVGPRRMDYQKSLKLFKSFENLSISSTK
ncbi:MAG: hypothetical protein QMD65_00575 [Patescibacteria group bacterium]|nr:hypothetical protein [Patescibacteria group bacterium]